MILTLAAHAASPEPATFDYELVQRVRGVSGAYVGYSDVLRSSGRYEASAGPDRGVALHATYRWSYSNNEGKRESGREDREVAFDGESRRYTSARIDLDDDALAAVPPGQLAIWAWFGGPDGPARVLDLDCTALEARDVPRRPGRAAWKLTCTGDGVRNDDYGVLDTRFEDVFWYDRATGWILAERYTERATGTVEGEPGAFVLDLSLDVTAASYAEPVAAPVSPPSSTAPVPSHGPDAFAVGLSMCSPVVTFGAATLVGLAFLVMLLRHQGPPAAVQSPTFGTVRVSALTDPLVLATLDLAACSERFAPFLEELARRSLAAGDPVWIAVAGGRLAGYATWDRAAKVGTVLGPDPAVTSNLARRLPSGGAEFFSEHRHEGPAGLQYNVHEDWKVLVRDATEELPYDRSVVRRYQDGDRAAVLALLKLVWDLDAGRWLDAELAAGDLAFVAVVDGAVVGVALAQVVGDRARFPLAVVHPAHRDRGLGGELVRARLTALHHLGVGPVMVEVASWNVAALHLLRRHGFRDAGALLVQSSRRSRRQGRGVVRR